MRDNLYYRLKSAKKPSLEEAEHIVENSIVGTVITPTVVGEISDITSKSGGRPKGSTKVAAKAKKEALSQATTECAVLFEKERALWKSKGGKIRMELKSLLHPKWKKQLD